MPLLPDEKIRIHAFVDQTVSEIYLNHGRVVLSGLANPHGSTENDQGIAVFAADTTSISTLSVYAMGSIWNGTDTKRLL
jgi:hypothetical protein